MGDDIQAIKAGILEIADLFVINKADRPGADRLEADLAYMLELSASIEHRPEIRRTIATRNEGVEELCEGILAFTAATGRSRRRERRRERAEARFRAVLADRIMRLVTERVLSGEELHRVIDSILERQIDPYTAAEEVAKRMESG